jgi:hypothetical protein
MTDLLYLTGTLGFFAAMLAYVRGLRRLGAGRYDGDFDGADRAGPGRRGVARPGAR